MSGFPVLSPDVLRGRALEDEVTLPSLIEEQDRLAEEAREVLPYSFDECTFAKGPLRQNVWSCLDCNEKGVCYGCSISCHADHRLVELWTRRGFQCDCPTSAMCSNARKHKCTLNPPDRQPQPANEGNRYSKNFKGEFCRCGRDYDPETEVEAMINCIGCEDWLHESCLNLQPRRTQPVDDDEDEEALCLIPSESYDALVCAECVTGCPLLMERAGMQGWMIVEPSPEGTGFIVVGRSETVVTGAKRENGEKDEGEKRVRLEDGADGRRERPEGDEQAKSDGAEQVEPAKTPAERHEEKPAAASQATPSAETTAAKPAATENSASTESTSLTTKVTWRWKGAGDLFLAHGLRERLQRELDPATIATLPFPLVDEEIYEPPRDTDPTETLDEVTERVVGTLPRVQAIEALHGFQNMKDKLKVMLQARAESGNVVSKEDIESFFAELRRSRS